MITPHLIFPIFPNYLLIIDDSVLIYLWFYFLYFWREISVWTETVADFGFHSIAYSKISCYSFLNFFSWIEKRIYPALCQSNVSLSGLVKYYHLTQVLTIDCFFSENCLSLFALSYFRFEKYLKFSSFLFSLFYHLVRYYFIGYQFAIFKSSF